MYSKDISDRNNNAWLLEFSSIEEKNIISGLRQITDNVRPNKHIYVQKQSITIVFYAH